MAIDEKTFKLYMKNPSEHFDNPMALAFNSELTEEQKKEILKSWKLDEQELQVAADENMSSEDADRLARVQDAISKLLTKADEDTEH